jgi:excisionase family DNA binding protein
MRRQRNGCQAAIHAVANELTAVRVSPAYYGKIVEPNAHLAALSFSRLVTTEIWQAADPLHWAQCFLDPSLRMDSQVIVENFGNVRERFRNLDLPDAKEIIVEVQWEAARAALVRPKEDGNQGWLTVSEAATISGCERYEITRAVNNGSLKSNGAEGTKRRIDKSGLTDWILRKTQRGDANESNAAIERKLKRFDKK